MRILQVQQGTESWHAERARRFTASEAPAMMGASKFTSRSDLLKQKSTGIAPEVTPQKQALFDRGHAAEAGAREIVEEMIGEPLFPATAVHDEHDHLLASFDGITMTEDRIMECKLWSESLAAQVRSGELEPHYYWQLEAQLLVSGAEVCIFVCSDGTREKFVSMEYRPVPGRREALLAGWEQFRRDLAAYVPADPVAPAAVAAPMESLPAVQVRMDGALTVYSNLDAFGEALRAFVAKIPAQPTTDQEFADCEAACKSLKRAEEALEQEEARALAGMADVEKMRRIVADLANLARTTRLQREKLVKARKDQLRLEQVKRGRDALAAHLQGLNRALGGGYMPDIAADFGGAIAGKKTMSSIADAIDTELARAKIAAGEVFVNIQANLNTLRQYDEHAHLFPDKAAIVQKKPEDLQAVVASRIAAHREQQERKLAAERERIRREEEARAQRMAAEQAAAEREAQEAERRRVRAEEEAAERAELERRRQEEWLAGADEREAKRQAEMAGAVLQQRATAAPAPSADNVVPMPTKAPTTPPSMKLGEINARLHPVSVDASGLTSLGFPPAAVQQNAKLYHEHDFPRICAALVAHITSRAQQQRAA